MIIWTFFKTLEDIYRHKNCYFPNALRPTSFSYLDSYCAPLLTFNRVRTAVCNLLGLASLCGKPCQRSNEEGDARSLRRRRGRETMAEDCSASVSHALQMRRWTDSRQNKRSCEYHTGL